MCMIYGPWNVIESAGIISGERNELFEADPDIKMMGRRNRACMGRLSDYWRSEPKGILGGVAECVVRIHVD